MYILTTFLLEHFQPLSLRQVVWSPEMSSMNVFWQIESDDVEKRDQVKNLLNSKAKKLRYKDYIFKWFFSPISALAYIVYVTLSICHSM